MPPKPPKGRQTIQNMKQSKGKMLLHSSTALGPDMAASSLCHAGVVLIFTLLNISLTDL